MTFILLTNDFKNSVFANDNLKCFIPLFIFKYLIKVQNLLLILIKGYCSSYNNFCIFKKFKQIIEKFSFIFFIIENQISCSIYF